VTSARADADDGAPAAVTAAPLVRAAPLAAVTAASPQAPAANASLFTWRNEKLLFRSDVVPTLLG